MHTLNEYIDIQLDKQYKARALVNMCKTLHRAGLLRLLRVDYHRSAATWQFDEPSSFTVHMEYAQGDHYEWTI